MVNGSSSPKIGGWETMLRLITAATGRVRQPKMAVLPLSTSHRPPTKSNLNNISRQNSTMPHLRGPIRQGWWPRPTIIDHSKRNFLIYPIKIPTSIRPIWLNSSPSAKYNLATCITLKPSIQNCTPPLKNAPFLTAASTRIASISDRHPSRRKCPFRNRKIKCILQYSKPKKDRRGRRVQ